MQLKLTLMGALKRKSPAENPYEIADGATIHDVLAELEITSEQVQMVMVNSKPKPDRTVTLADGDELTFIPPVGGG